MSSTGPSKELLKDWMLSLLSVAPTYFLLFHTHVKYFVLNLFMWCQVMFWCLHACGVVLLHEYFQCFVIWFDIVGKPSRINNFVCHYASVCFLAYIPCHLNWS